MHFKIKKEIAHQEEPRDGHEDTKGTNEHENQ